ncbi:MAG TPA: hypothetical protein VGM34_03315 [Chlamydiales bacterium]|jgi:hypothetical protein
MEIEFQVHIVPKEKQQQLLSSLAFFFAIGGSFYLFSLLVHSHPALVFLGALVALFFIARTSSPYFRLRKQSHTPDRIQLSQGHLIFFTGNQKTLRIPIASIQSVRYQEGLLIFLRDAKCTLLDPRFKLAQFLKKGKSKGGDLFFESFDASVQARLQDIVQMEKPHHTRSFQNR